MTAKKKLGLKQRYAQMTRGLDWETTYQPMDKVFPYDQFEGIKIKDWSAWEDPFRLTMDAYWKFQAEKERKLYAVIDAFADSDRAIRTGAGDATDATSQRAAAATHPPTDPAMIRLPGGEFRMGNPRGDGYPADGETPVHAVRLRSFWIDPTTVTNADFGRFVDGTRFVTESERYGWSFVFGGLLPDDFEDTAAAAATPWWRQVFGADWRHPEGPHSSVDDRLDHPVVQVSWTDAAAYAQWVGKDLPTEAEWEYAARAGLHQTTYTWGNELQPNNVLMANTWQGHFPYDNHGANGWIGTAPVGSFPPTGSTYTT